jgi:phospholipase/carboxylesterase
MRETRLANMTVRITGGTDGSGGGDGPLVVLMHGFGAPGTDLVPLAREMAGPPGTRFVLPEAPLVLPPELGAGRAWWLIDIMRMQLALMTGRVRDLTREVPEGMQSAREHVLALLEALDAELSLDRSKLVLGGFSQGAMLACDVALRTSEPLAGLLLMSGTFLAADEWTPLMPSRAGLPVLMSHGRQDPLLPFELAEQLRDALREAGLPVTWVPFEGGHGIAPSALDAASKLIRDALAG